MLSSTNLFETAFPFLVKQELSRMIRLESHRNLRVQWLTPGGAAEKLNPGQLVDLLPNFGFLLS